MRRASILPSVCLLVVGVCSARADDPASRDVKADFDDVRFELSDAILRRGLSVHSEGNLGKMLDRTGADVGSTTVVYTRAEFITVCSAKYARQMVEADATLMGHCPFTLYVYSTAARPDVVTVGYRRVAGATTDAGRRALADIETMLGGIVTDACR